MGVQACPSRREIIRAKLSPEAGSFKNSPGEGNLKVYQGSMVWKAWERREFI